ncbi:MAG TPA: VanZ family protein [Longimicrobiales bacterium]
MRRDRRSALLILAALAAILIATLPPTGEPGAQHTVICLICGDRGAADAVLNVLLFLPLGAAFAIRRRALATPALFGAACSCLVELTQVWIPGRDASPGDLVFNTLGALAGAVLVRSAGAWLAPGDRRGARLAAAGTAGALLALACGALLLRPALPRAVYYGQWTPDLGHLEHYRGRVVHARVGGDTIPSRQAPDSRALRRHLRSGTPIVIDFIAGPATPALAPIFSIYDEKAREVILIGADREDAVFRFRTRAVALRFDQPDIRLRSAFAAIQPGRPLRLAVWREGRGYCIEAGAAAACGLGFTLGDTWGIFLYPESLPGPMKRFLGLGWIAALFLPAGFWATRRRGRLCAAAAAVLGLALIPPLTGLLDTPPTGYVAAIAGILLGTGLRAILRGAYAVGASRSASASAPTSARIHRSIRA